MLTIHSHVVVECQQRQSSNGVYWSAGESSLTMPTAGAAAMPERTCSPAATDQNEQWCCPPGVCRRSIARRALVFRGRSSVPARRAVSIGVAARPFPGRGAVGRCADRCATWWPRVGVTRRLPLHTSSRVRRPFRNHPSEFHPLSTEQPSPPWSLPYFAHYLPRPVQLTTATASAATDSVTTPFVR